jgi:hypothetical protein
METDGSFPFSREPAIGPWPEPHASGPQPHILASISRSPQLSLSFRFTG